MLLVLSRETGSSPVPVASPVPSPSPIPVSSPLPLPEASPTPPEPVPLQHVVQPGETLSSIAAAYGVSVAELIEANHIPNPDLIRPGEVLFIPGRTVTVTPSAVSSEPPGSPAPSPTVPARPVLSTLPPSGPPGVEIAAVLGAGDLARETVRLRNRGGIVLLESWSLSDTAGDRFIFPRLVLFPGAEVFLHSGPGASTPTHLYWGRTSPAWESGGLLTLRDSVGEVVDTYIVP